LEIKNSKVSWKINSEFQKDGLLSKSTYTSINPEENININSKYYLNLRNASKHKKGPLSFDSRDEKFSVITPSLVPQKVLKSNKVSLEDIWEDKSVLIKPSNPNPQFGKEAYSGVRKVGY
jgi:hypothetical protein